MGEIEDVLAAGADAVMTYLYMGYEDPEREKLEIGQNARLARACERWGVAMSTILTRVELDVFDRKKVA